MSDDRDDQESNPHRLTGVVRNWVKPPSDRALDYGWQANKGQRLPGSAALGFLLVVLGCAVIAGLIRFAVTQFTQPPAVLVSNHALFPTHKLDTKVAAMTVEQGEDTLQRLLVADERNLHIGRPIGDMHYWSWVALRGLKDAVGGGAIEGLAATERKLAILTSEGPHRGVALGNFPEPFTAQDMWPDVVIDTTHFPGLGAQQSATALFHATSGHRLVGAQGIGAYDPVSRSWIATTPSDAQVYDLVDLGKGMFAALGAEGAQSYRWDGLDFQMLDQVRLGAVFPEPGVSAALPPSEPVSSADPFGAADPFGGPDPFAEPEPQIAQVVVVPERERRHRPLAGTALRYGRFQGSAGNGSLTYITAGQGLGSIALSGGRIADTALWVGEGRAQGLSYAGLRKAVSTDDGEAVWFTYETDDRDLSVAHYLHDEHRMSGLPTGLALNDDARASVLSVDSFSGAADRAWVGRTALVEVETDGSGVLDHRDVGLGEGKLIDEVAPAANGVFVVLSDAADDLEPRFVSAASRLGPGAGSDGNWQDFIGNGRVAGLRLEDITAATELQPDPSKPASIIFGTKQSGLARFDRRARDLRAVFEEDVAGGRVATGTLDIHAQGPRIVQTGADHGLYLFDAGSWRNVIPASGTKVSSEALRLAAARGSDLVIGGAGIVATYSAERHEWFDLPRLDGLKTLAVALDEVWAVDGQGQLYRASIGQRGSTWRSVQTGEAVVAIEARDEVLSVITQKGETTRLWLVEGHQADPQLLLETNGLEGSAEEWRVATLSGDLIYLAPMGGEIGRYKLTTRTWSKVTALSPEASAQELVATPDGLWVLDSDGALAFAGHEDTKVALIMESVELIRSNGNEVAVLGRDGTAYVSNATAEANGLTRIIGAAMDADSSDMRDGVVFDGDLYVASSVGVHRYDVAEHGWINMPLETGVRELTATSSHLYALTSDGAVLVWTGDTQTPWTKIDTDSPIATLSGSGGDFVTALTEAGALFALFSGQPMEPVLVLAASRLSTQAKITAAIETNRSGQDGLMIGTAGGAMLHYAKDESLARVWSDDLLENAGSGPVRKIVQSANHVAVLSDKLHVLEPSGNQEWSSNQPVLEEILPEDIDLLGEELIVRPATGSAGTLLAAYDLANASTRTIVGSAAPTAETTKTNDTQTVAMDEVGKNIWRANSAGQVDAYDVETHSWRAESDLTTVSQFGYAGGRLYAYSSSRQELWFRAQDRWDLYSRNIVSLAGDENMLLLLDDAGNLIRQSEGREVVLHAQPDAALALSSLADAAAIAEFDGRLFLALREDAVLEYDTSAHSWRDVGELSNVSQFAVAAETSGVGKGLFALSSDGGLWHRPISAGGAVWRRLVDDDVAGALFVAVSSGAQIVAMTDRAHLLSFDANGTLQSTYRPKVLEASDGTVDLVSARPAGDKLLVLVRFGNGDPVAASYAPLTQNWQRLKSAGIAARFHSNGDEHWLASRKDALWYAQRFDRENGALETALGPFLNISSNQDLVVGVTEQGRVVELVGDGAKPMGIGAAMLPEGRRAVSGVGAGDGCTVLMDDGSVYAYTTDNAWKKKLDPNGSGSGSFVQVGEGALLLVRPDGSVLRFTDDAWTELEAATGTHQLKPEQMESGCKSVAEGAAIKFQRLLADSSQDLSLDGGRMSYDVIEEVQLTRDELWVTSVSGPRRFGLENGLWVEKPVSGLSMHEAMADPTSFDGAVFSRKPVPGDDGALGLSLETDAGPVALTLRVEDGKFGFTHDFLRSGIVAAGAEILAPSAAGLVRIREGKFVGVLAPAGLVDISEIAQLKDRLVVTDAKGSQASRGIGGGEWDVVFDRLDTDVMDADPRLLSSWRVSGSGADPGLLSLGSEGQEVPVTLTEAGFGFDRIWGFALTPAEISLYSEDGLLTMARAGSGLPTPGALDARYRHTAELSGAVEVVLADGGEVWFQSGSVAEKFDGTGWKDVSAADFENAKSNHQPELWDRGGLRWDRFEIAKFERPIGAIEARFVPKAGRFDLDMTQAIVVTDGALNALTPAGVLRYFDDGRWQDVSKPGVGDRGDIEGLRLLARPDGGLVLADTNTALAVRETNQWRRADAEASEFVTNADRRLLQGDVWQVIRTGNGETEMSRRFGASPDYEVVRINAEGRFDFESLSDNLVLEDRISLATTFGVIDIDPTIGAFVSARADLPNASEFGMLDGVPYARLSDGRVIEHTQNGWAAATDGGVFEQIAARIVDDPAWRWVRDGARTRVTPMQGVAGLTGGAGELSVGMTDGRLDFDNVTDVAPTPAIWLATSAGLVQRGGAQSFDIAAIRNAEVSDVQTDSGKFASNRQDDAQRWYSRLDGVLHVLQGDNWIPVSTAQVDAVLDVLGKRVAQNDFYNVTRDGTRIDVEIKFPDSDHGQYQKIRFDRPSHRFAHDVAKDVAKDSASGRIFLATSGGIVSLDQSSGQTVRLYSDEDKDGIGPNPVTQINSLTDDGTLLAQLEDRRLMRLDVGETSKWGVASTENSEALEHQSRVPHKDPDGWRIERSTSGGAPALQWRQKPVWLVDVEGSESTGRFAHDVINSAVISEDSIRAGTRGGLVEIPLAADGPLLADAGISGVDEMSRRDRGFTLVRPAEGSAVFVVRDDAENTVSRYAQGAFVPIDRGNPEFQQSAVVVQDAAWTWMKSSYEPVVMETTTDLHLPASYEMMPDGTFAFLDIAQVDRGSSVRSVVGFEDLIYVATRGGVAVYRSDPNAGLSSENRFIEAVFAVGLRNGRQVSMTDIRALDVTEDAKLVARDGTGQVFQFDPVDSVWNVLENGTPDPFPDRSEIADTAVLGWQIAQDGTHEMALKPLAADEPMLPPEAVFANGRFAFDEVNAALPIGDDVWIATAGGLAQYRAGSFEPVRYWRTPFVAEGETHAMLRELIVNPDDPEKIILRDEDSDVFAANFTGRIESLEPRAGDADFAKAYTREDPADNPFGLWLVQVPYRAAPDPEGALLGSLHDSSGRRIKLQGSAGTSAGSEALPLFANQRFAHDDIKDVALVNDSVWATTPIGILRHATDWDAKENQFAALDFYLEGQRTHGWDLRALGRIEQLSSGHIIAWRDEAVFRLDQTSTEANGRPEWLIDTAITGQELERDFELRNGAGEKWFLQLDDGDGQETLQVAGARSEGERSNPIDVQMRFNDVSRTVMDDAWLYLPHAERGIVRIDKAELN